ncbi:MAG: hypothetical protein IPM55_09095 [Acidobacteria bacterium]|nr:hypothetical protein [Acidobacteriota bacterium]
MIGTVKEVVKNNEDVVKKAIDAGGEQLAQVSAEAAKLKVKAAKVMDESAEAARKALYRGRHAAEEMIDETQYRIKRRPFESVAITLGVGLGLGALVGWLAGRKR